ncbi:hypothetical protein CapIbe_017538 [Capra ibex]
MSTYFRSQSLDADSASKDLSHDSHGKNQSSSANEKERGSGRRANSPYFTAQEDTQTLNWKKLSQERGASH